MIKKFMIHGGNFSTQNGTGGERIYCENFDDENFHQKHNWEVLLSKQIQVPVHVVLSS